MNNQQNDTNNGGKEKRAERDSNFFCRLSGLFAVFDKAKSFSGGVAPNDWLITSFTASAGARYHEADNGNFFNFVSKNKAKSKYLANLERGDRVVIEAHPETTTGQDGKKYMQWVIDMATIVSNRNNQNQGGQQQSGGQPQGGGQPTGGGYPQGGGQPYGAGQYGAYGAGQPTSGGQPQSGQYPAGGTQYGSYTPPTGGGQPTGGGYPQGAPSGQPSGGQPQGGSYPSGGQPSYPQGQYGGGQPSGGQPSGGQPSGGQPSGGQPGGYPQGSGQPTGGGQPSGGTPYPDGFGMGDDDDPFGLNSGAPDNC